LFALFLIDCLIEIAVSISTNGDTTPMIDAINRRTAITRLLGAAAAGLTPVAVKAAWTTQRRDGGPTGRELGDMNRIGWGFMRPHSVPGMSVAIARNGKFVYSKSFGAADRQKAQLVASTSLFRIANLSMPITAVATFLLIEKGQLHLNDKVFGPSGILGTKYGKPPYQQYVADISVDHLLTHTSGGWGDGPSDPMFHSEGWDQEKLIEWTLDKVPLASPPGQSWVLSNFGYCVLGRVTAQVSGQTYANFVQNNILGPCGINDMKIAGNKMGQRAANEVVYTGQYSEEPYKINVERMDSCAGWIATSSDMAIFLDHVGGAGDVPSLLKPETIRVMTTPTAVYPQASAAAAYAKGWMVSTRDPGIWWHTGSLPGSTGVMVRTGNGMAWAAMTNTRTQPHAEIDAAINKMGWDMVGTDPQWGVQAL
jgi:CubicO group peptidase (beta-lactamase class C family)